MTQQFRYDPSITRVKQRLEPIEWEKLPILDESDEEQVEQPKKQRKKRRPKDQLDRKRLLEVFNSQYSSVKWNLFGTLNFYPKDLELWRKKRAFDEWIDEMTSRDTEHHLRWLRIIEHSASGDGCRFHVFVKTSPLTSKYILMARWQHFVGADADLWYFTNAAAARQYLADTILRNGDFEIEEFHD